ncbi:MAG: 16S rRNA (cytosine(967)-C(5))-methyltransferase RsmB [Acidobacteriota bacterium]
MIAPARLAAFDASIAVSAGRLDLSDAVAAARRSLRDDRDKALTAEIVIGVQRWRAALDHLIVHFSKRRLDRLDPEIVEILRLSAYQLLHLTRVPASAVVDDAVNLAGRSGKRSAAGLVNAVLRALSRSRQSLPLPPRPQTSDRGSSLDYLAISLSHPRWLVERWLDRYGFDATERWLHFNNAAAPLTLRANRFRHTPDEVMQSLAREDVTVSRARFAPDALIVEAGQPLSGSGLARGWFVVQDEASQLAALLPGAHPGDRVLDTCASPGGKTTAIAARMRPGGLLVACDVRERRIELLRHTVDATGAVNVRIVQADLTIPPPFSQRFDCVFVDAPCSGLGTLRRDPDIKWRRREDELATLAGYALQMLTQAAAAVAPGGRLVYTTCSSEPDENERVATAFLSRAPTFVHVDARDAAPALPAQVVDQHGHLRTYPHVHELEAFFGAVFARRT